MKDLSRDIEIASKTADELIFDDVKAKESLARIWERSAAFHNGNQQFVQVGAPIAQISGSNFFVSQSQDARAQLFVTNEIEPIVRAIVSYLTRSRPTIDIFPSDRSERSRQRADLAEKVMMAKYDLDRETANARLAAYYACIFGSVFRKDYWDMSLGAMHEVPDFDEFGNEIIDETGQVKMQTFRAGDNAVAILTPFCVGTDLSVTDFTRIPYIYEQYQMDMDWAKTMYNRQEPGYTGKAESISEGDRPNNILSIWENMKYAAPYIYGSSSQNKNKGKAIITEFHVAPCDALPYGRYFVKVNTTVVYDSYNNGDDLGSPYYMPLAQPVWHPYSMFSYSPYVGRLLGKSLVEGLIPLQMRLNELNGAILMNANTMGKSIWLAAERQLAKGTLVGVEGIVQTYRPRPDAPAPQRQQGVPLPPQFFKEKQDLIEAMVREAGTNFVMQGQPPQGVTAAAAIEQLLENANTQQSDMMISWEKFHEEGLTKKLRLIRSFMKYPNEQVVDYFRTLDGDTDLDQIQYFTGEDIGDGLTLKIESGSMIPKSEKAKRDFYQQVSQGFMAPFLTENSPRGEEVRAQYFEFNSMKGFDTPESNELKKARWENGKMLKGQPMPTSPFDNVQIHLPCHTNQIQDPNFLEKHPVGSPVYQFVMMHIEEHQMAEAQMMQQQMIEQAAMAPPQGGQPPTVSKPQMAA